MLFLFADTVSRLRFGLCLGFGPLLTRITAALQTFIKAGFKPGQPDHRQRPFDQRFDIGEQIFFVPRHQTDGMTIVACASGTADTVHVIFGIKRQLKVHHMA